MQFQTLEAAAVLSVYVATREAMTPVVSIPYRDPLMGATLTCIDVQPLLSTIHSRPEGRLRMPPVDSCEQQIAVACGAHHTLPAEAGWLGSTSHLRLVLTSACCCVAAHALQAYERGQYQDSVQFLEKAVEQTGKASIMGGEAMMWLALAYQVRLRPPERGMLYYS